MPYKFGYYSGAQVEIPELDAFFADLDNVLKKHGIAFEAESEEGNAKVVLVPYSEWDAATMTQHLDDYYRGIPFLDCAKAEWKRLEAEGRIRDQKKREAEYTEKLRLQAEASAAHEAAMKANGLKLSDGTYRLVKVDPN